MPRIRRPLLLLSSTLLWLVAAAAAPAVEQPVQVRAKASDGAPVEGARVTVDGQKGKPFHAEGLTDAEGSFGVTLPDAKQSYHLRVDKEGYVAFDQSVDLAKQRVGRDQLLTMEVTLPAMSAADWFNRGVEALRADDLDAAAAAFDRSVAIDDKFDRGWSVRGMVAAEQKKWDVALDSANHALALAPQDTQALRTRYDALVKLGRRDEAESALDQLVTQVRDGEVARLAFNSGADAANRGQLELARKRFGQTLELAPELWQAHSALAELSIREKSYEDALTELDRALAAAPRNVRLLERKIEVLKALGDDTRLEAAQKELAIAKASGNP